MPKLNNSIEDMQNIALEKGGWCLSTEYIDTDTKLWFTCKDGHIWDARPTDVKIKDSWCPYCYGKLKKSIEDMQKLAEKENGKCLSKIYIDSKTKLSWQCKNGHKFKMVPNNVQQGSWCPKCRKIRGANKRKGTIEEMQSIALNRGGWCLSHEYFDSGTKLLWQCGEGHIWNALPTGLKRGNWCRKCYDLKRKKRIKKYNRNYKKFPHKHKF